MAKDDESGILGWQAPERVGEDDALFRPFFVLRRRPGSPHGVAERADLVPPPLRDRHVQRDAMEPGLGRGVGLPSVPCSVGSNERLLRALLGLVPIPEDADERLEDPVIAVPEEAVEILSNAWAVVLIALGHRFWLIGSPAPRPECRSSAARGLLRCREDSVGTEPSADLTTNSGCMDRTKLLSMVSSASSLNQISSVMAALREWLAEHPEDAEMRDVVEGLLRTEHGYLDTSASGRPW